MEAPVKDKEMEYKLQVERQIGDRKWDDISASAYKTDKLHKFEVMKLSGNMLQRNEYSGCFYWSIDQSTGLSEIDKFKNIKAKLEAAANVALSGVELTGDNYPVADR